MKYLVFIPLLFLFSCNKDRLTEKDIPGEWKITEFEIDAYELNEVIEAIIEKIALSTTYYFEEDGTWESVKDEDVRRSGNWSYSEEHGELTLTYSSFDKTEVWVYKNDFEFECILENPRSKAKKVITKE